MPNTVTTSRPLPHRNKCRIIALFSWNLIIALKQHSSGLRISIQQELQLTQATQTEVKLKAMMSDLIELSKQDKDAQKIVTRYKIAINK